MLIIDWYIYVLCIVSGMQGTLLSRSDPPSRGIGDAREKNAGSMVGVSLTIGSETDGTSATSSINACLSYALSAKMKSFAK
jgi:hypothetical protein